MSQNIRLQWQINDYSAYTLSTILLIGQQRFFHSVIYGQLNYVSVLGDGTSQIDELHFQEVLEISTSSNVDLEELRIEGNRVKIYNSSSSTIEVEIGITGGSLIYYLFGYKEVNLFFNGTTWIHQEENVIIMTDSNLTLDDLSGPTKVILPSSGITADRTVTLPTLADNQGFIIFFENKNSTYILTIDGEGSETVNGFTTIGLQQEWCKIDNNSSGWNTYERSDDFYIIPEDERPNSGISTTGTTPIDIDFSSYIEYNRIPTKILTKCQYAMGSGDVAVTVLTRKKGSTETDAAKVTRVYKYRDTTSGNNQGNHQIITLCDEDGVFQAWTTGSGVTGTFRIEGYWYK